MLIAAKILLTIMTLGYSAGTVLADLNKTHATNPLWTGHARFHLVWQVLSYNLIGLLVLILIWAPGPHELLRLYLAAILAACIYVSFFATLAGMRFYGGANYDDNAYPPFKTRLIGSDRLLDMNTTVFVVLTVLLFVSIGLLYGVSR